MAKPTCAYPAGWQKLANKVGVAVYCPGWLPDPLTSQIGGRWNNIDSVSKDRSWLESFVWQETGGGAAGGELHVNLRGYPGRTAIPTCRTGGSESRNVPCFSDPGRTVTANGITARLYTRQPGRRRLARAAALAQGRHAVHALRARRAAAHVQPRRAVPEAGALLARAHPPSLMKLTRRQFVVGTAAGAVGAAGLYELVDQFTGGSPQRAAAAAKLPEQHLLEGVRVVRSDGVEVLVPPLHHQIMTARVAVGRGDLAAARVELEGVLSALDADYAPSPAGLGVTVAWGQPYLDQFVPDAAQRLLPHDRRAGKPVLIDAERFPSDPGDTRLEQNDVVFLLRSDSRDHIDGRREAHPRHEAVPGDVDPPRLRRRRLRRRPVPAEADGAGRADPRRRPDPRHGRVVPRLHVDAEARAWGRARSRTSRRSATSTSAAATTSGRARTCTCRTSTRTSRRGTSTSTSTSASRRRSSRTSTSSRERRRSGRGRATSRPRPT